MNSFFVSEKIACAKGVFCNELIFNTASFDLSLFHRYKVRLPESVCRAVKKRQAEFLAGRYAAHQLLEYMGQATKDIPIGIHSSPVWPTNIIASISHTSHKAICVATHRKSYDFIGVDIEEFLSENIAKDINDVVAKKNELDLLIAEGHSFVKAMTILFSAKESIFKALYPYVKCYFDFSAVKLCDYSKMKNELKFVIQEHLTQDFTIDRQVFVKIKVDNYVKSLCLGKLPISL